MRKIDIEEAYSLKEAAHRSFINGEIPSPAFFTKKYGITSQFDTLSVDEMCEIFFHTWKNIDVIHSEATLKNMVEDIFDFKQIIRDINSLSEHINIQGKKILDTGSCWGSVALYLRNIKCDVTCIDHVIEHVIFSKLRLPSIDVYHGDVCDMDIFEDNTFDVIISRGVIEHIGNYDTSRGKVDNENYQKKFSYMKEMNRILKEDGELWISTGNYSFPFDGETNKWFFHWLPQEYQDKFLHETNNGADKYWLLTWEQMDSLINKSGFDIYNVKSPDIDCWREHISRFLNFDTSESKIMIDILMELIKKNPHFMSSWNIALKKKVLQSTEKIISL